MTKMTPAKKTLASCRCGKVEMAMSGKPLLHGICYCTSCQEAGRRHQARSGLDRILAEDGGTDYVLYRKDRVRCSKGGDLLEERRLKPDLPTRRMFARCCDSAMFLDFTKGHWLTVYRGRLPDDIAPATMRMMTAERPKGRLCPMTASPTSRPFPRVHAEAPGRLDGDGIPAARRRGRALNVAGGSAAVPASGGLSRPHVGEELRDFALEAG